MDNTAGRMGPWAAPHFWRDTLGDLGTEKSKDSPPKEPPPKRSNNPEILVWFLACSARILTRNKDIRQHKHRQTMNGTLQYRKHKRQFAITILTRNAPERFSRGADEDGARPTPPMRRKFIYLFIYLLTYLLIYLPTYPLTYLFIYLLTYLLILLYFMLFILRTYLLYFILFFLYCTLFTLIFLIYLIIFCFILLQFLLCYFCLFTLFILLICLI